MIPGLLKRFTKTDSGGRVKGIATRKNGFVAVWRMGNPGWIQILSGNWINVCRKIKLAFKKSDFLNVLKGSGIFSGGLEASLEAWKSFMAFKKV